MPCKSAAHDQVERLGFAAFEAGEDFFQRHRAAHRLVGGAVDGLLAPFGGLLGLAVAAHDFEDLARVGHFLQAQDDHGRAWPGFLDGLALVVEHRLDAPPGVADDDGVAALEGAVLHQQRGGDAAEAVQFGLDDGADAFTLGVGLELFQLGHQQDVLQQVVDAHVVERADGHDNRVAAPLFGLQAFLGEFFHHALRVGVGLVDLVERHDDDHARGLGVADGLARLRHDAVVGGDHQHDDVRHLGATRAHGGEGFMTRRVEEGDLAPVDGHLIGAGALRNAARLAAGDVGVADAVQQRRLAVVDMAQHRHDGRAFDQVVGLLVGHDALDEVLCAAGRLFFGGGSGGFLRRRRDFFALRAT